MGVQSLILSWVVVNEKIAEVDLGAGNFTDYPTNRELAHDKGRLRVVAEFPDPPTNEL